MLWAGGLHPLGTNPAGAPTPLLTLLGLGAHLLEGGIFHSPPHASSIGSWGPQPAARRELQEQRDPMPAQVSWPRWGEEDVYSKGT